MLDQCSRILPSRLDVLIGDSPLNSIGFLPRPPDRPAALEVPVLLFLLQGDLLKASRVAVMVIKTYPSVSAFGGFIWPISAV